MTLFILRAAKTDARGEIPQRTWGYIQVRSQHRRALRNADVDLRIPQAAAAHHAVEACACCWPRWIQDVFKRIIETVKIIDPLCHVACHIQNPERTRARRVCPNP